MTRPRYRPKRIGTVAPTVVKSGAVRQPASYPSPKYNPNTR